MGMRVLVFVFLLFVLYVWNAFANPFPGRSSVEGFRPLYGFSWSFESARWLGLDARTSYSELLANVRFDWVRLPFFWDTMIVKDGGSWVFTQEFEDLKFAIEEAKKHNVKVIVALGAKTPYFPEFHLPEGSRKMIKFGENIDGNSPVAVDLLAIDAMVVTELSAYDNIIYW